LPAADGYNPLVTRAALKEDFMSDTNQSNDATQSLLQKAYGQLGKIIDAIVILRVTTVVGTVSAGNVTDPMQATTITIEPTGQLVAHSAINTALGDADLVFSKGFLDDATLTKIHTDALEQSRAIRKDSMDMLRSAIDAILGRPAAVPPGG
jgi:hypothetical protein